jgi:hypothetical protein
MPSPAVTPIVTTPRRLAARWRRLLTRVGVAVRAAHEATVPF